MCGRKGIGAETAMVVLSAAFLALAGTLWSADEMTVIFTASTNGVLESCHCPGNRFGGLVNRAAVFDSLRGVYPEAVVVDAGDFLAYEPDSLKSVFVIQAMRACGYDAIQPGDQDLALGVDFLLESGLPLLISPYPESDITYLGIARKSFERGGNRILIGGAFGRRLLGLLPDSIAEELGAMNAIDWWRNRDSWFEGRSDLVIVLSHQGFDRDVAFLEEVEGVDLVVSGHSQMRLEQPERHGGGWVVAAGKNAEYVGVVRFATAGDSLELTGYELIPLTADKTPESPEVARLVKEYNRLHRERLKQRAIAAGRRYYGTADCGMCHRAELEQWSRTPHSRALTTLVERGKSDNASCLECHTTGFGFPGGFVDAERTPGMAGVGCEECHIIPTGTQFAPGVKHPALKMSRLVCTRCHTKPHIIEFDYDRAVKRVSHRPMIQGH